MTKKKSKPRIVRKTFHVEEASAFVGPQVAPDALIFRNGTLQTENSDYDLVDGCLQMRPSCLKEGDRINVVTIHA